MKSFSVVVPASSANLGPGFDSMAIALAKYMTVKVVPGTGDSINAQMAELSGGPDMVLYAMQYFADAIGRDLPPAQIQSSSHIPVARGMGSSAAAVVAGLLAGNRLLGDPLDCKELVKLASEIEGHADNVAAAMYGGVSLAMPTNSGYVTVQLAIGLDLRAVVLIPERVGFTKDARAVVPEQIDRSDAVFNSSRCAMLVHAFANGRSDLLAEAMQDRWHQPYRAALYSYLDSVIEAAVMSGASGASLSGSGPTVLALVEPQFAEAVSVAMHKVAIEQGVESATEVVDINMAGARICDG